MTDRHQKHVPGTGDMIVKKRELKLYTGPGFKSQLCHLPVV